MRRTSVVALLTAGATLTASLLTATSAAAEGAGPDSRVEQRDPGASDALATAQRVMAGGALTGDPDPTMALRELSNAMPRLAGEERRLAGSLLARPTDQGDQHQYSVDPVRTCSKNICIHWVKSTEDQPPSRKWVRKTLRTMERVWDFEVGELGYRSPIRDRGRGGNGKFDVYLKDLGSSMYGYCAPDKKNPGNKFLISTYCVLDNDMQGYASPPTASLKATASHEFFHAIQAGYDWGEDAWMLESSATWMEERFADDVNDNRYFLQFGQLAFPQKSLDLFDRYGLGQYGNWTYFEYLSSKYGRDVVREIWEHASERKGDPGMHSTEAIATVVDKHGGDLGDDFVRYAAANTVPRKKYEEGGSWGISAPMASTSRLSRSRRTSGELSATLDHLTSASFALKPEKSLHRSSWNVKVSVDGPARRTQPRALVLVRLKSGKVKSTSVRLNRRGNGSVVVPFSSAQVRKVSVTVANTSVRMRCWQKTDLSCQGIPKFDDQVFTVSAKAVRR